MNSRQNFVINFKFKSRKQSLLVFCVWLRAFVQYVLTRSSGALWAPTSSMRPFGPPLALRASFWFLDFFLILDFWIFWIFLTLKNGFTAKFWWFSFFYFQNPTSVAKISKKSRFHSKTVIIIINLTSITTGVSKLNRSAAPDIWSAP